MSNEDGDKFFDGIETETGKYQLTISKKAEKVLHVDKEPEEEPYDSPEHETACIIKIQDRKIELTFSFRTSLKTGSKVINIFKGVKKVGTVREDEYLKTVHLGPKMDEYFIPTNRNKEIPFSEKEKWLIDIFDKYHHADKLVRKLFNDDEISVEEFMDKFGTGKDKAYKYLHELEKVGLLKSYETRGKRYKPKKVYKLGMDKKVIQYIIKRVYNIE